MASNHPIAIDLFSGAGGLTEGFLAAGINVAVAVEKHPHPALTSAFNHPNTSVVCSDLVGLDGRFLESLIVERTGKRKVDIIAGGPPCQGFSLAGKQDQHDPRNSLFREFVRVVEHFKPAMVLFENVPGFAKLYNGVAAKEVSSSLRKLGYELHKVEGQFPIVNAAHWGVPQRRNRFILIGWLKDIDYTYELPKATHASDSAFVSVGDAIGDLDFLRTGQECHTYQQVQKSEYQFSRRSATEILFNHLATRHRRETINMYRRIAPGANIRSVPDRYRSGKQTMSRMADERCSNTVLALPDDFIHYRRHRIPTVREMARLQSFDDDYVFMGKRTTSDHKRRVDVPQYTQVGNAVPPLMARAIGVSMMKCLGYRSSDIRDIATRLRRHEWVCGSSGYAGYSLCNHSNDLALIDRIGNRVPITFAVEEVPAKYRRGVQAWTGRPRLKSS